jgi:hypothetical protein
MWVDDAMDHRFLRAAAAIIHDLMTDHECTESSRAKAAVFARRIADIAKQGDPTFSYEWFYGACGLDPWGDLLPVTDRDSERTVKWDPELNDFRRI